MTPDPQSTSLLLQALVSLGGAGIAALLIVWIFKEDREQTRSSLKSQGERIGKLSQEANDNHRELSKELQELQLWRAEEKGRRDATEMISAAIGMSSDAQVRELRKIVIAVEDATGGRRHHSEPTTAAVQQPPRPDPHRGRLPSRGGG